MSIVNLFTGIGTASTLIFLAIVAVIGLLFGKLKIFKIKVGIAGVLFVGLFIGHLGAKIDPHVLHFIKEFGLILFVYSIGMEIGPRFIPSLRQNGLKLNLLASGIVFLGLLIAILIKIIFNLDTHIIAGIFTGSVTNTPALGAAQSLISELQPGKNYAEVSGMAYALAYPFGIIGIILAMYIIRLIFKINIKDEIANHKKETEASSGKVSTVRIKVSNPNLFGKSLKFMKLALDKEFVFSRIYRNGDYIAPDDDFLIEDGDIIVGLCGEENHPQIELKIGKISKSNDNILLAGQLSVHNILITNRRVTRHTLGEINLSGLFPANITRVFRGDNSIIPSYDTKLEFGDVVRVVGARDRIDEVAKFLGNSQRQLATPNIVPLFIGVFLGILVGSIPITIPGLPFSAKLGLAGGPLIVALLLGHKGRIGKLDFYINRGANRFIRELGIVLFLATVGIGSGHNFVSTLVNGGYYWMLYGASITFLPLIIIGIIARLIKLNYLSICGLLSGAMTDPPALEFANSIAPTQIQAGAYATVYPVTMFLRILTTQIIVIVLS